MPNPGSISMYTSGWPKNQNKCWKRIGSPPPVGSKKVVLMFRSVKSIVIAPASTGRERRRRIVVMNMDQTNKGIRSIVIPGDRMLIIVVMNFMEAMIDDAPARWREKIARSTHPPAWAAGPDKGGYTVQPVPTPLSLAAEVTRRKKEGGINQKLIFFIRGKAMSGAPIMRGTNHFPNPPIMMGITMKKIITNAWAVTITL